MARPVKVAGGRPVVVAVRFSRAEAALLDGLAAQLGWDRGDVIRRAVEVLADQVATTE